VRDRQYMASLALSGAVFIFGLAGIVMLSLWLGWLGALGLATVGGGFLVWFYWGPRPDLGPGGRTNGKGRQHHA